MTTQTPTLTEFLLARIAEDEIGARRHAAAARTGLGGGQPLVWWGRVADRVLAECEAKRRIVEEASGWLDRLDETVTIQDRVLAVLAAVYADHPDYEEAWRP